MIMESNSIYLLRDKIVFTLFKKCFSRQNFLLKIDEMRGHVIESIVRTRNYPYFPYHPILLRIKVGSMLFLLK